MIQRHHYFDFTLRALSKAGNFTSLPDNEQIPGTSVSPMGTSTTFGMFKCEMKAGCQFAFSFAAMPATCGDAMLVPLNSAQLEFGSDERTFTPGAVTSGLSRSA